MTWKIGAWTILATSVGYTDVRADAGAVLEVVERLAGAPVPASALETLVLPGRIPGYSPALLDELTSAGEVVWSPESSIEWLLRDKKCSSVLCWVDAPLFDPGHPNDHNRSMSLRTMSDITGPRARFYSLQKDPRREDAATLAERSDIVDLTPHLADFVETAALIACLDLVVTVDTGVAGGRVNNAVRERV